MSGIGYGLGGQIYWKGRAKTHAMVLRTFRQGIGIGGIISTGNYALSATVRDRVHRLEW